MYDKDLGLKRQIFTVSEITSCIKDILEGAFYNVFIRGEVSNLRSSSSGHLYFVLKDDRSKIRAVLFSGRRQEIQFELSEGMDVIACGDISVYERGGEYQLVVSDVFSKGVGTLYQAFEALKLKLQKEGLFDVSHKKPLPQLPRRVGIITSPTGAAIRDMLNVLRRRFSNIEVLLRPVKVQGEGSAEEIVEAIEDLNQIGGVDVILLGRGGGSFEDLWSFNEEAVARAIFRSSIPIVSCVGHETDFTIADFVSDLRAPTPSAGAELVVKKKEDLESHIFSLMRFLRNYITQKLVSCSSRLKACQASRSFLKPFEVINIRQQAVDELTLTLHRSMEGLLSHLSAALVEAKTKITFGLGVQRIPYYLEKISLLRSGLLTGVRRNILKKASLFDSLLAKLTTLDPKAVLRRGYSIVYKPPKEKAITGVEELQRGDLLRILLARGEVAASVEDLASKNR